MIGRIWNILEKVQYTAQKKTHREEQFYFDKEYPVLF
jgi:hypothetical protein